MCSSQLLENKRSLLNAGAKDLHCYIMIWQGACADVVCKIGKSQCRKPPFESNSSAHKLFCTTTFNVPLQLLQIGSSQKNKRVKARKTRAPHTPSTPTPKLILSSAEEGGANDLRPVIYLHKESAVRRNQDTENDHHNMERDSFQNI